MQSVDETTLLSSPKAASEDSLISKDLPPDKDAFSSHEKHENQDVYLKDSKIYDKIGEQPENQVMSSEKTVENIVVVKQEAANYSPTNTENTEDKRVIEIKTESKPDIPVKSSMEILSELFSTFDAEPPVIVKKEKSEHKKHKKDKKKHKHKKKKEKRKKSESDEEEEETLTKVMIKSEISSPKRIKLEKEDVKVKKEAGGEKEERSAEENSRKGKILIKDLKFSSIFEATIREIKEKQDKDLHSSRRSHNKEEEKSKRHKSKHHVHKSEKRSESKEKRRSRDRTRSRSITSRRSDEEYDRWYRSRDRNDYYRDNESNDRFRDYKHSDSDKSREKDKRKLSKDRHSKYEPEDTFKHRSHEKEKKHHHRSRSGSRESSGHIDKKKLLEIARRNAIQMMKSGSLPGALTLGPQAQEKVIAAIKAGGKTVEELTDFCKTLSQQEALGELSSGTEDNSDSDNDKAFHHPFQIKDRPTSITMNIKNAIPLPTKTTQERTAELRIQFPVSSGQQHRTTETEWVAVPQKKPESKQTSAFTLKVSEDKEPQQETVPAPTLAPPGPQVFPKQPAALANLDVGAIVSQRLSALRKLQENPNDSQAITEIYRAQKEMQSWAQSKQQPGQFTGSTGAQIMSKAELSAGHQAWAKKDQLMSAAPVSGGMGMHLLQKMGWKPGEGLGKEKRGALEPLLLEVKLDKKGLVANEEQKKKPIKPKQKAVLSLQGKHPVSLLGEYASKRKIGAPQYELCFECGPDHKKNFLFKVLLNGVEYQPNVASPNKKEAKANAAAVCLQHLGLLPVPAPASQSGAL